MYEVLYSRDCYCILLQVFGQVGWLIMQQELMTAYGGPLLWCNRVTFDRKRTCFLHIVRRAVRAKFAGQNCCCCCCGGVGVMQVFAFVIYRGISIENISNILNQIELEKSFTWILVRFPAPPGPLSEVSDVTSKLEQSLTEARRKGKTFCWLE